MKKLMKLSLLVLVLGLELHDDWYVSPDDCRAPDWDDRYDPEDWFVPYDAEDCCDPDDWNEHPDIPLYDS